MSEPGTICPPFNDDQLALLELMFTDLGKQILERANNVYCCEGSSSIEAVSTVGSIISDYEPKYAMHTDRRYEGD